MKIGTGAGRRAPVRMLLAGGLWCLGTLGANAGSVDAEYAISLAGLPIGSGSITGQVDGARYSLNVKAQLSGFATVVTSGRGAAQASGALASGKPLSGGYALTASNSQMTRTIQVAMATGNVGTARIEPPFDEKPDRVPVTAAHKRGVVDPVSALVMPMAGDDPLAPANCNRTLPIFDGAQRFDVSLVFSKVKQVKTEAFQGTVLVCKARYTPIAGHRPNREATKYMANNREMEAWLVPVDGAKVLFPYRIAVKTMIGTTVIEATRMSGASATASR